jgi:glyoxylase-like metal-dependent hydrolase (beta-lactamase superfamily II)
MRELTVACGVLFTLTDASPPPAAWGYSFPEARLDDHPNVVARWLPDGLFQTRFAAFAFERNGRIILVDAGLGPEPSAYFDGLSGRLDAEFRAAGLRAEKVEHLIFTHFHLDHVGWATGSDGEPAFPNATYHAPRAELDYWQEHGDAAALPHHRQAVERQIIPLLRSSRLMAAEGPVASFGPVEVSLVPAPGHTPGHSAVMVASPTETVLIGGDTWHSPAQVAVPDWCHRADWSPAQARLSRRALARLASDRNAIVAAGHFLEDVSFGRILRQGEDDFAFSPLGGSTA